MNNAKRNPTLFSNSVFLVFRLIGWCILGILGTCLVAVLLNCALGERGLFLLQSTLRNNQQFIATYGNTIGLTLLNTGLAHIANPITEPNITWIAHLPAAIQQNILALMIKSLPYVNAVLLGAQLAWVKLTIIVLWCPVWLVVGVAAWFDGITARSIRRYQVASESAAHYHQQVRLMAASIILGIMIIFLLPANVHIIEICLIISTLCFALTTRSATKVYQKYR